MIVLYRGIELAFLGYHPVISTECSCCYLVIKCPFERWCLWRTSHSLCSIFFLWHDCFGSCFIIRFLCSVWTSIILTPLMLTFTQLCFSDRSWTHNWKTLFEAVMWMCYGQCKEVQENIELSITQSSSYEKPRKKFPPGFPIKNSSASTEKLIWFPIMVPVNLAMDHALVTGNHIWGHSFSTPL